MTHQLKIFYQNWLAKADSYNGDTLAVHFDKFTSLYVVFNALYMDIRTQLNSLKKQLPKDFDDKKVATDHVIQYLNAKYFIDKLFNDTQSIADLDEICTIVDLEKFHIILHWGNHQRKSDLKLVDCLKGNNSHEKAKAVLSLFYHIRCNMFHGHKGFEEGQSLLLSPINRLLRKTVEITFNKLSDTL